MYTPTISQLWELYKELRMLALTPAYVNHPENPYLYGFSYTYADAKWAVFSVNIKVETISRGGASARETVVTTTGGFPSFKHYIKAVRQLKNTEKQRTKYIDALWLEYIKLPENDSERHTLMAAILANHGLSENQYSRDSIVNLNVPPFTPLEI